MSEVVNLNKARKTKARDAAKAQAAENRVKFGRTKAEKAAGVTALARAERSLDGVKREP